MVTLQVNAFSFSNQSGLKMNEVVTAPIAIIFHSLLEQITPSAFIPPNYF
jgi:hypothetical protein